MFEAPYLAGTTRSTCARCGTGAVGKEVSEALLKRKGIQVIGVWNRGARQPRPVRSGEVAARPAGPEDPHHAEPGSRRRLEGARRDPDADGVRRGVHGPAPGRDRRPGEPARPDPVGEPVRGAEEPAPDPARALDRLARRERDLVPPPARQPAAAGARRGEIGDAAQRHDAGGGRGEDPRRAGEEDDHRPGSELDLAAFRDRLKGLPEEFARTWKKGLYEQIVATK